MSSVGPEISDNENITNSEQILDHDEENQSKLPEDKNDSDNKENQNDNSNENAEEAEKLDEPDNKTEENPNDKDQELQKDQKDDSDKNDTDSNKDGKSDENEKIDTQSDNNEKEKDEKIDKSSDKMTDSEEKQDDLKDMESNQITTDGFISNTESVSNSESPIKEENNNESKADENPTLLQQTDSIVKAIIGSPSEKDDSETPKQNEDQNTDQTHNEVENTNQSENEDQNPDQTHNEVENTNQSENEDQNPDQTHKEVENTNQSESEDQNPDQTHKEVENVNPSENEDQNTIQTHKEIENANQSESDNQNTDQTHDEVKNANPSESEDQKADQTPNEAENVNPSENEDQKNDVKEAESNTDTISRDINSNEPDSTSSHPLSNMLNSMTEKIQNSDTVQITDAFSQTDPVPISVSCQTSFPPSEMESEEENAKSRDNQTQDNQTQNYQTQEYQNPERESIFASFNCRCTQTRKLDKSLPQSINSGSKSNTRYLRPRKTSQTIRPKTANKTSNNALFQLEISQPISPIQFRSGSNSALSSNVGSPKSSAASTLSSTTENKNKNKTKNNVKPIKNIKNTLPIISSKNLSSNTARPRINHSGFSSSSGPEPTKTPNIKTGKLSMIKNGNSTNSKSCVLKRNTNLRPNTTKSVLSSNKSSQKNLSEDILSDATNQIANDFLPEDSQSDEQSTKEKAQNQSEASNLDEKNNETIKKKKTSDSKIKSNDLDEQINALTANLLPGYLSSTQNSSCSKKSSNPTDSKPKANPKIATTSISTKNLSTSKNSENEILGGTSQIKNDKNSESSSSIKGAKLDSTIEEEEVSSDDPDAPKIIKKRDYQGNTTEINFTDDDTEKSAHNKNNHETETEEEHKNDSASTTTAAAADDESGNPDYEQMIDDLLLSGCLPSDDETEITQLFSYIKRREIDSIMNEDYTNCDRLRRASALISNSRNRARFISAYYNQIDIRLAKAESDLEELQNIHKDRMEQFESQRLNLLDSLRDKQQQEIENFESFWSHQHALLPFDKASSGLLDLRFKQKQSALIKEFSTASDLKSIADSRQIIEEDGAIISAESSMKTSYQQLLDKHAQQDSAFDEKMQRHRTFLQNEADNEIARQKLIIQQLEAKRDDKYDARARNDALSEIDLLSEPVTPRTFESFTKFRKDGTSSKLRLNSTTIVQTLHQKKQTKRPFTPGKTKRYGGYC